MAAADPHKTRVQQSLPTSLQNSSSECEPRMCLNVYWKPTGFPKLCPCLCNQRQIHSSYSAKPPGIPQLLLQYFRAEDQKLAICFFLLITIISASSGFLLLELITISYILSFFWQSLQILHLLFYFRTIPYVLEFMWFLTAHLKYIFNSLLDFQYSWAPRPSRFSHHSLSIYSPSDSLVPVANFFLVVLYCEADKEHSKTDTARHRNAAGAAQNWQVTVEQVAVTRFLPEIWFHVQCSLRWNRNKQVFWFYSFLWSVV